MMAGPANADGTENCNLLNGLNHAISGSSEKEPESADIQDQIVYEPGVTSDTLEAPNEQLTHDKSSGLFLQEKEVTVSCHASLVVCFNHNT